MTKIAIDLKRRNEIKNIVYKTLLHSQLSELPVDIKKICKSFDFIRVIPFSIQMKRRNMTYAEICAQCESEDACADYYAEKGKYIIYYNDILKWKYIDSNRYRWSLAHELGHILLKHHIIYEKTKIFRCNLSDAEYDYVEAEADYFAALILVPHAVLSSFHIINYRNIRYMCKISDPASKRRYKEYLEWKSNISAKDEYDYRIFYYYFNFIFKRKCLNCEAGMIQRYGTYCPICGQQKLNWGDGNKMKYPLFETLENGKLKECPICHNEDTYVEGEFCQICGNNLINRCSNYDCPSDGKILPSNARYCPICGKASTFFNAKYLKPWNFSDQNSFMNIPEEFEDELPFSPYHQKPEIDEELPFN